MTFDDLQSKWQSHDHSASLNINSDALLKEVRQKHRALENSLWWRDFYEIAAAVLVSLFSIGLGFLLHEWTLHLCAAGALFVGVFFIGDRRVQYRRRPIADDSLQSNLRAALFQVQHQIWLLENVVWWYLLPIGLGVVAFLGSLFWKSFEEGPIALTIIVAVGLICARAFRHCYRINQQAVKQTLEPRRAELLALLSTLEDSEDSKNA